MRNLSNLGWNVRSAIAVALLLVSAFVVLDSYTWRLLSVPWSLVYSSRMHASSMSGTEQHVRFVSPAEAEQAIAQANKEWGPDPRDQNSSFDPGNGENTDLEIPDRIQAKKKSQSPDPRDQNSSFDPGNVEKTDPEIPDRILAKKKSQNATNLQKIEAVLSHARAAIRRAVLLASENVRQVRADEEFGDVYRNATIFQQSYSEMEKHMKVFVYPEGEEPLVHNGPCKEIYAIEGRFIQELQGKNLYLTQDPEKAHVFFLPFSVAMMVTYLYTPGSSDMSPLERFANDYVNVIKHKYPFWNRSTGADHFMLSCHDWGPHVSRGNLELSTNSIRMLCNANTSEGYIPHKDASLPEIHLIGGEVPKQLGGPPGEDRKYLAFFAGGNHGPVRPVLFEHWQEKDEEVRVFQRLTSRESYQDYMRHSKYCLCPGGYEVNSPRIVEAIYNDCVPVIIADFFVLPFSDVLNWDSFSLKVAESEIPNLKKILHDIPTDRYLEMQRRIKHVRKHFVFNQPPQKYDVFNMILHSVWLRRLNMIIHS